MNLLTYAFDILISEVIWIQNDPASGQKHKPPNVCP